MLFNSLYASESGVDIVQVVAVLPERLKLPAFKDALARMIERHAILRTAFRWEGLPEPLQEVVATVPLPLEVEDWRDQPAERHQQRLDEYIRADRRRGFTLTQAPLIRLTLIQLAEADYRLIFAFHHTLLDGRSLLLLMKELFALYEAGCRSQDLALPQPRPYQDYIEWQRQQDQAQEEHVWRDLLKGFTAPTLIAVDGQDRYRDNSRGGYTDQDLLLTTTTTEALTRLAQQHDLTVNTLIQGAWALLLSQYSGQDDVVFGVTRRGRYGTIEGVDSMIGLFITTLPIRVRIVPDMPLLAWLKELRSLNVAIRDHQRASLAQVQQWSEVPQGVPLFNTIVVFERYLLQDALQAEGGQWANRTLDVVRQPSYPLTLAVFAGPQLLCRMIYDHQRYDRATIERMLARLELLLEGMLAQPEGRLDALPRLPAAEWHQLSAWNATHAPYPAASRLPDLVAAHAAQRPHALALVDPDHAWSYHALDQRANQLAHLLQARGVAPDVCVALVLDRSAALVLAQLAVLKAGGGFLPLDPAAPAARTARMLHDAQPALLLTTAPLRPAALPAALPVLCLDADRALLDAAPTHAPTSAATLDHLAYLIYTSGSTGTPKGVAVPQRGLLNLVAWHQRTYALTPADRATLIAAPAFDASVWELWPYLASGACLVIPDAATRATPQALVPWLAAQRITVCFLPTALAEAALAQPWPSTLALRALLTGGDQLHPLPAGLPFPVFNHYGPTETSVVATATPVAAEARGHLPPIGQPIANTEVYLLDGRMQPVPLGVTGEVYIGGVGMARGYHRQPTLTAARFVPHPFSRPEGTRPGARLYRTGDLARYRADGALEFLGRIDGQVKLRGYRIELGEIEAVLGQHPAVRAAVVLAREDRPGAQRLVAYVVGAHAPTEAHAPTAGEARR
ncbi:MAG TPA: amino acid adenylation domain-containing protein, partial [Herpetosiphonaceae bacterium]